MDCICGDCGVSFQYKRNGSTKTRCVKCAVNKRRYKLKKRVVDYLGGECAKCGYDRCYGALQAHHVDPSTKEFQISGSHTRSWERIVRELDKCVLLCANCHNEEHHACDKHDCPMTALIASVL